jgi:hypothetical protein
MDTRESIRTSLAISDFIVQGYLSDLTPQELLARPCAGANHIAWQVGHLIRSERFLAEMALPGAMPALPADFADRHSKSTCGKDDASCFLSKAEYLSLAKEIRAGTLKVLDQLSEAQLDEPAVGKGPPWVKRRGDALITIGGHWAWHVGQWVVVRRNLGREIMF